ncbi:MAG TPA: exodeoxyribonuclease VII large subunit [Candidatus Eisenbacteria bacterium]
MAISPAPEGILTVTALTRLVKEALSQAFPAVWVRGEVTGFKRAASGHCYLSLKDGQALLECVAYSRAAGRFGFEPRDGVEVEAFGAISVYEPRGRYQLVVEEMRPAGLGALLLALEELKRRLQAEGLFDDRRKRPLPPYPSRIGLVTSPVGAAVRDLVKVLRARWPSIRLVLGPVRVQGEGAAREIASAIERFNRLGGIDVLIVGRGGGSLEDLWAFNDEAVVRAIVASRIPVISAVGHEVDWTLADWAADRRAATPSNAGEIAVRDRVDVLHRVERLRERADRATRQAIADRRGRLARLLELYGFRRQRDAVGVWQQRADELKERLAARIREALEKARGRLEAARDRYGLREWPRALGARRDHARQLRLALRARLADRLAAWRARLVAGEDRLRALSPRRVLERGYCLVRSPDGRLLRTAIELRLGESITVEFARGEADARVEAVRPGEGHDT